MGVRERARALVRMYKKKENVSIQMYLTIVCQLLKWWLLFFGVVAATVAVSIRIYFLYCL